MFICRWIVVCFLLASLLVLTTPPVRAFAVADAGPVAVTKTDKCPVCGMFVSRYPDFQAQIVFTDESHAFFDGAKDMFNYFFNLKKYTAAKSQTDIASIYVTDYYGMTLINGRAALYVTDSDVFGPMGRELIPFQNESDAREFMKDHSGKRLLRFDEVTQELVKGLQ